MYYNPPWRLEDVYKNVDDPDDVSEAEDDPGDDEDVVEQGRQPILPPTWVGA